MRVMSVRSTNPALDDDDPNDPLPLWIVLKLKPICPCVRLISGSGGRGTASRTSSSIGSPSVKLTTAG